MVIRAKLTQQQKAEIKRRAVAGEKQAALAAEFGVCQPTICKIKNDTPRWRPSVGAIRPLFMGNKLIRVSMDIKGTKLEAELTKSQLTEILEDAVKKCL